MRLVAHRGIPSLAPENTLASFAKALDLGATALEFDVHLTADGRCAVLHDETVDRTTNGVGKVAGITLEDIQRLKIEGGHRIPSLDEVLDWAAGNSLFLHVEIKAAPALRPAVELLMKRDLVGRARISSFWHRAVKQVKAICPQLETGVLYAAAPVQNTQLAIDAGADALHPHHTYVTEELVREARSRGLKLTTWTVDAASELERLAALDVDEVVTNVPHTAKKVLEYLATRPAPVPREKTDDEKRMDAERASIQALMKSRPGCDADVPRTPGKKPSW
ncbi:MAG: glycerophosphodiester phosphodiesterase [Planctomycetia bacterium]|nr:glycerophosphodiester phosphodiesterase [Planctomycetia bacterium]